MKLANGAFKPAYNIQVASDVDTELILATKVTQSGTDGGEMLPMYQHLKDTYDCEIEKYLVDQGYKNRDDLRAMHEDNCLVYMPTKGNASSLRKTVLGNNLKSCSEADQEWIHRMETKEAQKIYHKRLRASESANAFFRNHGLGQFLVRGKRKIEGVINLFCLSYNILTINRLFSSFDFK